MRYIYNGVAPFTQKKAPSCTSFRVRPLRPHAHRRRPYNFRKHSPLSSRTCQRPPRTTTPKYQLVRGGGSFAWDLTKYFAGLTLYNNIIVYVLPYIYYNDHRPAANGFGGFYVKTIYKLYGMGDLWHVLCRCMDGFSFKLHSRPKLRV